MDLQLSPEEELELYEAKEEIIKHSRSLNPFKRFQLLGLRDFVSALQDKKDRELEEEKKVLSIKFNENDTTGIPKEINRALFQSWTRDKATFYRNRKPTMSFDDLIPGDEYYVARNDNFEGFSQAEGDIQTRDCVNSIMSNLSLVPPFGQPGTEVYIEIFEFNPPPHIDVSGLNFNFPIRPDAILIHGTTWLLIESKHAASNSHCQTWVKKRDFIWKHRHEKWIHRNFPVPTRIIGLINSVKNFTTKPFPNISSPIGDILLFAREELDYNAFQPRS